MGTLSLQAGMHTVWLTHFRSLLKHLVGLTSTEAPGHFVHL